MSGLGYNHHKLVRQRTKHLPGLLLYVVAIIFLAWLLTGLK
jgi:hypothetical protein